MPGNARQIIVEAERRFPVRVRIGQGQGGKVEDRAERAGFDLGGKPTRVLVLRGRKA